MTRSTITSAQFWRRRASAVRTRRDEPFVFIDKNLCNYPLARDTRTRSGIMWRSGKKTGDWLAELPGDARIKLRFPGDVEVRRAPTAFDMNVLFLLLSEARRTNSADVQFPSRSEILKVLGYGIDAANLRRVSAALDLWSSLTIVHSNWYFAAIKDGEKWTKGSNGRKRLPPPIEAFSTRGGVGITVNDEWRKRHSNFWEKVPLPLPRQAAAQNLVLCLLTSIVYESQPGDPLTWTHRRGVRQLCYKLGLNHTTRNRVFWRAVKEAEAWFKHHGGFLSHMPVHGDVAFNVRKPGHAVPRVSVPRVKLNETFHTKPRARLVRGYGDDGEVYEMWQHSDGRVSEEQAQA